MPTRREIAEAIAILTGGRVAQVGAGVMGLMEQTDALNPAEYVSGFIIPTNSIHCGIDQGVAWTAELDVGFLFEVHTEKLSLQRIQELLVSLTAN